MPMSKGVQMVQRDTQCTPIPSLLQYNQETTIVKSCINKDTVLYLADEEFIFLMWDHYFA